MPVPVVCFVFLNQTFCSITCYGGVSALLEDDDYARVAIHVLEFSHVLLTFMTLLQLTALTEKKS